MRKRILGLTSLVAAALIAGMITPLSAQEGVDKPIKHKVRVSAQILPLFAVTKSGEPVFDLTKKDLILYINGRKADIDYLVKAEYYWATEAGEKEKAGPVIPPSAMRRIVVVVMDSLFNTRYGINRMQKLTREIIYRGRQGDYFLVLGINKHGGLYHLAGPKPKSGELIQLVQQIKFDTNIRRPKPGRVLAPPPPPPTGDTNRRRIVTPDPDFLTDDQSQSAMYTLRVEKYFESLAAIRYLLMKYLQPKLVYLLSEGIKDARYGGPDLLRINRIIREINQAGAMIFTINPGRIRSFMDTESGKNFLVHVARESGGEFFENNKINKVVKKLDNTSRAYYEMVFHLEENREPGDLKIAVESRRSGIKLLVPNQATNYRRFSRMSRYGREFFIVDLIEGGQWSQLVSDVKDAPFEISARKESGRSLAYTLLVDIPSPLVSVRSDIYIVRLQKDRKTRIRHYKSSLKEQETLEIKGRAGEKFYFVIHEPRANITLFAKVK